METQNLLDEMITEDQVELLKTAMPYLPASGQRFVSIYAKVLELQNTVALFSNSGSEMQICSAGPKNQDPLEMLSACSNACQGPMKKRIDNMINTFAMLQLFELSKDMPK